jgi:glucan biosynthesis protein C
MAGSANAARIHHLDAVRCFCMLFGLMVHGATIGDGPFFEAVKTASDHFRMAAFFLVSGFFSAMVASRQPVQSFILNRSRLVLVPLLAGLLLLNPITNWLIHWFHGNQMSFAEYLRGGWRQPVAPPAQSNWHLHLWFLFSLFVYALLTPMLSALARSRPVTWMVDKAVAIRPLAPAILALSTGAATVVLRALHDQLLGLPTSHPLHFIAMATLVFLPFFAMGLIAYEQRKLFAALHQLPLGTLALFGIAYWAQVHFAPNLPWVVERASYFLLRTAFIMLIVMTILSLAQRWITRGSPALQMLTDAVYSFYIFHFLGIYTIAVLVQALTPNLTIIYLSILAIGYPLLLLLHTRIIARSDWLRWLWNGRPLPKSRRTA